MHLKPSLYLLLLLLFVFCFVLGGCFVVVVVFCFVWVGCFVVVVVVVCLILFWGDVLLLLFWGMFFSLGCSYCLKSTETNTMNGVPNSMQQGI